MNRRLRFRAAREPVLADDGPAGDGPARGSERLTDSDSLELVRLYQAGDREAFEQLYSGWVEPVLRYTTVALRSRQRAEEATQDIFLKVLVALDNFESESTGAFRAWLFTIARNCVIDVRKTEIARPLAPITELDGGAVDTRLLNAEHALGWLQDPDLLTLVDGLPGAQRDALALRFMLDLSNAEIARIMGRNGADVYQLQSRALRHLETQLGKLGRRDLRRQRRRSATKRIKPLPVLGARRFVLEGSRLPAALAARPTGYARARW